MKGTYLFTRSRVQKGLEEIWLQCCMFALIYLPFVNIFVVDSSLSMYVCLNEKVACRAEC